MKVDFRKALARLVPVFMPDLLFRREGATARRCSRISPPPSCRPSSRRARCSARARCSRSTIASRWRRAGSRRRGISTSPPSRIRRWRWRSASTSRNTCRAAPRDWKAKGFGETLTDWAAAQRALEVLGRRPARGVQELGGGRRSAQSARRAPGRQRAHHAARAAAPRRHDGDPGEQARRAGAAAHAVAAGADRRTPISTTSPATCGRSRCPARTPA